MRITLAAVVMVLLTGCISYQADHGHGEHFSDVHPDSTTVSWLLENLGTPESVNETSSGTEIWHYKQEEEEETDVSLFIIFDFSNSTKRTRNHFFEIEEGVVIKAWQG